MRLKGLPFPAGSTARRAPFLSRAIATACALTVLLSAAPAFAEPLESEPAPTTRVQVPLDQSVALRAISPVSKVVVAQPDTVQVGAADGDSLYLMGKQAGTTNLLVYGPAGRLSQVIDVTTGYDADGLRQTLADALPGEDIQVTALARGLVLRGEVSSPAVAEIAEKLAQRTAPDSVISELHARGSQVRLDVRIVEITERRLKSLSADLVVTDKSHVAFGSGLNGLAGGQTPQTTLTLHGDAGRYTIDSRLQALEDKGQARLVAKPTLVALSGEKASFQAGGEFPYPVPNGEDSVSVEFRPYGAALSFAPVVREDGRISLQLDAELSQIDAAKASVIKGLAIPALLTRRAATTAEVRDGETLVIAGLFQTEGRAGASQAPWLADIPVLGAAFRAASADHNRRQLAIIVTPHLDAAPLPSESPSEADLLATAPPSGQAATVERPETPKAVSAPRGPPARALAALRDVLRPGYRAVENVYGWARRLVKGPPSAAIG